MIDRVKLKESVHNETRIWIKNVVDTSILFCGGFDAWVEHLEKTERKVGGRLIYGTSPDWYIFFSDKSGTYKFKLKN